MEEQESTIFEDVMFGLYKKAKFYVDNKLVTVENIDEFSVDGNKITFYFKVKRKYDVRLSIEKHNDSKTSIWKKDWSCTCPHASIRGMKFNIECPHIKACELYLILRK